MSIVKMLLLAGAMAFALEALLSHMHSKPEEEQPEDASEAVEDNGAEEAEGEADFSDDEEDDGEAEDVEQLPTTSCRACVKSAFRAMNPLTLLGESRVVFSQPEPHLVADKQHQRHFCSRGITKE